MQLKNNIVEKYVQDGFRATIVSFGNYKEYYISLDITELTDVGFCLNELFNFIRKRDAQIIIQMMFGASYIKSAIQKMIKAVYGRVGWPVMSLEHCNGLTFPLTGIQIFAVSGVLVKSIKFNNEIVGNKFEANGIEHVYLGDIRSKGVLKSKKEQTGEAFKNIAEVLDQVDMDFSNVARTWFYLDGLLKWYGEFNEARTDFFKRNSVFQRLVPASTGIGAKNAEGASLTCGVYAFKPKSNSAEVVRVESPLQCEAINYKSAFSRAVELRFPGFRKLVVSGTASILADGTSAYQDDLKKQIELTMEVVFAILKSRNMDWTNVVRSIVYSKEKNQAYEFNNYCEENNIPKFPVTIAYTDVCRDELLFEIELDAVDSI